MFDYSKLLLERSREAFESRYTVEPHLSLSEGGMSTVWLVRDKHDKRFVVKRISRTLSIEVDVLQQLDHPNICRLIEVVRTGSDAFAPDDGWLYLVLEYCEGGDLFDRISQDSLPIAACQSIVRQVASALAYCHARGVLYGDLKPENIACLARDTWEVKLIDWGLSVRKPLSGTHSFGTQVYAAPEILAGSSEYSEACDMYSLGVTLFVMVFGEFPDSNNFRFPAEISDSLKNLISGLMSLDLSLRPSAAEVLTSVWLDEADAQGPIRKSTIEGLRGFARQSNFRKACVSVAAKAVAFADLKTLHRTFIAMDRDGNGVVTWTEFLAAFKEEDERELRKLFEAIDSDGSGQIDYSEFLTAALMKKRDTQREVARDAFRYIDKDDSGFIEKDELESFVRTFDLKEFFEDEALNEVICKMTNDGKISLDQFEAWLTDRLSDEISEVTRSSVERRSTVKAEVGRGSQLGLPIRSRH